MLSNSRPQNYKQQQKNISEDMRSGEVPKINNPSSTTTKNYTTVTQNQKS